MNGTFNVSISYGSVAVGFKVPMGIFIAVMIVSSLCGNSVVCFIVYRKATMRSAINLLLANMAASDILLSVLCMPFSLVTLLRGEWLMSDTLCKMVAFLHMYLVCTGMCILLAISLDRYFIIVRRKDKLNPTRAKVLIVFSWVCSLTFALPPAVGWGNYHYYPSHPQCIIQIHRNIADKAYVACAMTAIFFLPIFTMAYSYLCILKTVRKNQTRIRNHPNRISVTQASKLGLPGVTGKPNVDMSFKTRTFKTILILYIVSLCCWTPYSIATLALNFSLRINPYTTSIVLWLGYLNSALNPLIYAWRIKKFREACISILPKSSKLFPRGCGVCISRRVNPSTMYEYSNHSQGMNVEQSAV